METAVAIVAMSEAGNPVAGAIVYLMSEGVPGGFLFAITNTKGYAVWKKVPVPFSGELQMSGGAQWYGNPDTGQAVHIPEGENITLRCGPSPSNPQDIHLPAVVPFNRASVLPAPPTRERVCRIQTHLQGLTYHTSQWGDIPAWFYPLLNDVDRQGARNSHKGVGDTHIPIGISEAYIEPGTLWPYELQLGYDFTQDLDAYRAIITPVICDGLLIDLPLAGDGLSVNDNPQPGEYNDPQGNTYGFQWLMANFERIALALKGDGTPTKPDLTKYIIFRPGWDAVFYGWGKSGEVPDRQPDRVREFGELFRRVLPNGYLAIEHTPGNIPCGDGGADFEPGGLMQNYDTIMSEFNSVHEDSCWQVVARMVETYHRPPDQPDHDDPASGQVPNPHWYLRPVTPRGPYYYVAFEPTIAGVYQWCRGRCTIEDVNEAGAYLHAMGCALTGMG